MNPTDSQPSRANEIWRRFAGMFGADALDRKFGAKPPPEWIAMLARLNDRQVDRGIKRLAYSGKGHVPTLPEFTKLCRAIGGDEFDEGERPQQALPKPDDVEWNTWDMAANRHLLAHLITRLKDSPRRLGKPASFKLLRAPDAELNEVGIDRHYLDASGELVANVQKLIKAKNNWAADMRDLERNGEVPSDTQRAVWNDYINTAESAR